MKKLILFFVILPINVWAQNGGLNISFGGTVENGGNSVFCAKHDMGEDGVGIQPPGLPVNSYGSYYVLDYARAIKKGWKPSDFAKVASWIEAHERVERILRDVSPRLQSTFEDFVDSTKQLEFPLEGAPKSFRRKWVEIDSSSYEIVDVKRGYAPPSCIITVIQESIDPNLKGSILTFRGYLRTVTRKQMGNTVEYSYLRGMLKHWEQESPLQYSMLLIHEWLWDHTKKLEVNQSVNAFLHSKEVERMSSREIRTRLRRLGLKF
jgi:hypothetical protein